MKKAVCLSTFAVVLLFHFTNSQDVAKKEPVKLSMQVGLSRMMKNAAPDSTFFLQPGMYSALEGNYFWKTFGLAAKAGYFSNSVDKNALVEFAKSRKAVPGRTDVSSDAYKGVYFLSGPAFQSSFNKWNVQTSLLGGIFSRPASTIGVTEKQGADINYYKNVFDQASSFAWSAGLSLAYGLTKAVNVGIHADYLTTKNNITNYDMARGGGHDAQRIIEQSGFLNTGVKLTYNFSSAPRDAASGMASGKMSNQNQFGGMSKNDQSSEDTCTCENKLMDAEEMVPHVVEIEFNTVAEAQKFLSTYQPILESRDQNSGLATGKRMHKPVTFRKESDGNNESGTKGMVVKRADGTQVFAFLPTEVDLSEVLSFEDGRVTVTVTKVTGVNNGDQNSTREAGTGMATGRRQYIAISAGDLDGDGRADYFIKSNGATGTQSKKDLTDDPNITWGMAVAAGDLDGDGFADYILKSSGNGKYKYASGGIMHEDDWSSQQKREAASGMASGKRTHKPLAIGDVDGDGKMDYCILSFNYEVKAPRDVATGMATGKMNKIDAITIKQAIFIDADLDGDGEFEQVSEIVSPRDAASGLPTGKMASKEDVYVWKIRMAAADLDGDGVPDGFVLSKNNPSTSKLKLPKTAIGLGAGDMDGEGLSAFEHQVLSPKDHATGQASGKMLQQDQGKNELSGVKQTMQQQVLTTKDSTGDVGNNNKTTVNTSRSNIRHQKMVACSGGNCTFQCIIELDGVEYNATIVSALRTKHDTAKNSIGNIR